MIIGKYNYEKSTRKNKKLMVKVGKRIIHFGNSLYGHFKDKTKIWKSLDHGDKTRKKNYLLRSAPIKDGKGNLTKDNPLSANFHARRILW
tara:strand:+ start:77 stop:346 length:270 start_codon:yes stop_codon:yes gene_type:complete